MSSSNLLCFAIICTVTFLLAEATTTQKPTIECYECEETIFHDHKGEIKCHDEAFEPPSKASEEREKNGIKAIKPKPVLCGAQYNACSKIYTSNYQVIGGKKVLAARIIERACASVSEDALGCDYDKGSAAYAYFCYCKGDECNSASISQLSPFLLLVSAVVLFLRF